MTGSAICQNDSVLVPIPLIDSCIATVERYDALKLNYELRGKILGETSANLTDMSTKYLLANNLAEELNKDLGNMTEAYEQEKKLATRRKVGMLTKGSGTVIIIGTAAILLLTLN